jgi:DNA-binding response OmpR family regulator
MSNPKRIFVVEDEQAISEIVKMYLEREGYSVMSLFRGDTALAAIQEEAPDLVILDIMLPGLDGIEVLRKIRAESDVPVIFLTSKKDELDRVLGLELGADDYVTKPFFPNELVARVKSLLRRFEESQAAKQGRNQMSNVIKANRLTLDLDSRKLYSRRNSVELTRTEFLILQMLMGRPGRIFQRLEIAELLNSDDLEKDTRSIDMHIKNLRRKILEISGYDGSIKSVRGVGYTFEN